MKRTFVRAVLVPDNLKWLKTMSEGGTMDEYSYPLLDVLATVLDARAQGEDAYITIGGPRGGGGYLLSVHWPDGDQRASGDSLAGLLEDLRRLL